METQKTALICKYSAFCNWKCEKCQWLKELQIVDLSNVQIPTFTDEGCDCS